MDRFVNKVVLITGGGGEMGKAIAKRLAEEGGKLVLFDHAEDALKALSAELAAEGYGEKVISVVGDVRRLGDCEAAVRRGIEAFGQVDVLVAAAGILRHVPVDIMTEEQWQDVIDINLTGVYHSVRALVRHMKERAYGRIVLISSIGGRAGRPGVGVNYAASKAGLVGMCQLLGYELGPWNITVNCVAPGPIAGGVFAALPKEKQEKLLHGIRLNRMGEFCDVAAAVAYLASDDASWTTGEVLDVNGGLQY